MLLKLFVLFSVHFFSWWIFLFLFSILKNYTAFTFKFKDSFRVAVISFLLHLALYYLITGRTF